MEKQRQLQEQKVLEQELKSIPRNAKVYRQQQNSCIFFQSTKGKEMEQCKKTIDSLVQEYRDAETSQATQPQKGTS